METVYLSGFSCWCWQRTDTYAYATINGNCLLVRFQLLVLATDRHIYATINGNCLLVRFQLLVLATDRHIRGQVNGNCLLVRFQLLVLATDRHIRGQVNGNCLLVRFQLLVLATDRHIRDATINGNCLLVRFQLLVLATDRHIRDATINGNCLLVRFQLLVLATDRHIRDNKWKLSTCPVSAIGVGNGQTHTRNRDNNMETVYLSGFSCWCWQRTDTYAYATINGNCLLVRFQLLVLATDRHIRVRDNKWKLSTCPVSAVGVGNGQTHTRTRQ